MSVPTFDEIKGRIAPVWLKPAYQKDILWAGIFGSVARNRAHADSDVDILVVFKEHQRTGEPADLREDLVEACGRDISLMDIWQGPEWAWGHVRVEALLSSRTVYGNRKDVEHLRQEAMTYIHDGQERLNHIAESVNKIKNQITAVRTYENFTRPSQGFARKECLSELRKIINLLDIQPRHHPIRTMLVRWAFDYASKIDVILKEQKPDVRTGSAPVWKKIWGFLQPTSTAMWSFDAGCAVGGLAYLRHMLASKRLADRFEEGGQVDDDMYKDILR